VSFARRSIGTFFALAISSIATLIWGVIVARTLGPTGIGILAITTLYPIFFFTIGHLTLGIGTIHYIGQKKYSVENFAANSMLAALSIGALLYLIFVATLPLFQNTLYKGVDPKYLFLAFTVVPLNLIVYFLSSVLQGNNYIREYNIVNLSRPCFAVFSLVILVLACSTGIMGAVAAFTLGFLFAAAASIYYVSKQTSGKWKVNFNLLRTTLKSSGKMHIGSVATFIYGQVGLMIANYYLVSAQVGYFALALTIAQFLFLIPQAAQVVLYPETAMATEEEAATSSARVCRHAIFWVMLAALAFGFLSKYIIWLFAGEEFFPSIAPLIVLLPGVVLSTVAQVLSPLWVRKGWFWYMGGSGTALAVISILLNWVLIPKYGIMGAAIANSLTYFIGFLITIGMYFCFVNKRFWHLLIPQAEDANLYKRMFQGVRVRLGI